MVKKTTSSFYLVFFVIKIIDDVSFYLFSFFMIPKKVFFTKWVGVHKDQLASFELALRKAWIEKCNLVYVSSILPPLCEIVSEEDGRKLLNPGQITFCVMARHQTNEPDRLVSAAIWLAIPANREHYGYLSEHHAYGETDEVSWDYAEDLAATMLATTFGIDFDADQNWDERKQEYIASGKIFKTRHISQSALWDKDGLWTTVISTAVFILE